MAHAAYRTAAYKAFRQVLLDTAVSCHWCKARRATVVDHEPPLALGGGDNGMVPSCARCNNQRGARLGGVMRRARQGERRRRRRTISDPWDG